MKPDLMTQALSLETREKNHVCGRATYAWYECMFTPPVAYKRIAIACKRNTLICKKTFIAHTILMSVTVKKTATMETGAILWKKSLLLTECQATSSLSLGRRAQNLRRAKQMVGLVAFELALENKVCGELGQILDKDVRNFSWPPDNVLFDSWVRSVLNCQSREPMCFRFVLALPP